LGGVFVGSSWCSKEYIEKTFGGMGINKFKLNNGADRWSFDGVPDGWRFSISLTFDAQGLVNEFWFSGADVDLS